MLRKPQKMLGGYFILPHPVYRPCHSSYKLPPGINLIVYVSVTATSFFITLYNVIDVVGIGTETVWLGTILGWDCA